MMPPKNKQSRSVDLTPEELGLIKLWIDQGAKGEVHGNPVRLSGSRCGRIESDLRRGVDFRWAIAACARANQIFIYHLPTKQLVTRLTDRNCSKDPSPRPLPSKGEREKNQMAWLIATWCIRSRSVRMAMCFASAAIARSSSGDVPRDFRSSILPHRPPVSACRGRQPGWEWLATGDDDGGIRLWNSATANPPGSFSGHKRAVNGLNFSPDSSKLVSASADKTIRVWDVAKGKILAKPSLRRKSTP